METFEASAFHPDFTDGRETGALIVLSAAVRFSGGGKEVELPLRGLRVREGGASDRLIFFEHPDHPEWSIYSADQTILTEPVLLADVSVADQIAGIRRGQKRGRLILAATLIGIVLFLAGLYRLKDPLAGAIARRIPANVEKQIGGVAMKQILLTTPTVSEAEVLVPLNRILAEIRRGNTDRAYEFELTVARDSSINAFALPGGHVVLNTGLILAAETPEEIAGVLAHEMAHVTRQHSMRQIISSIGLFALVQAVVGDVSGIVAVLASNGSQLLEMKFSRDAERDADRSGLSYLQRTEIDPRGMVSFFRRLQQEEKSLGVATEALSFLGTHPATAERIAELEKSIREKRDTRKEYRALDIDLAAIKRALGKV